jgi:putative Mg2+ transporter-C (MgtC) family protein
VSTQGFIFDSLYLNIALRLLVGGLIGLERSYHGRPAGFRTHVLVCLSTSLLMLVTVYGTRWFPDAARDIISLDPTRMAQGIMTGIGFLGAGTIMKEGLSVRGLTTAASIWITAAIGILVGIGFYFPAIFATTLTLGTLSIFRWLENRIPAQFYAYFAVRFARHETMPETEMRALLTRHNFTIADLSYHLDIESNFFEYRMMIRTNRADSASGLTRTLSQLDSVKGFRISPTGD